MDALEIFCVWVCQGMDLYALTIECGLAAWDVRTRVCEKRKNLTEASVERV